ncbi:SPASM domain-containing protein, partial [bacterium]|nr:SPASM domain-containing protein [bacterium]
DNLNSYKKRPMIDIKTIVLENNLDDLPKLYKMCTDKGFEFLSVSFLRNNNLKQNSKLFDNFVPEFNQNYPISKYFDLEHFREVYAELESLKKNSKTLIRFSPKFENSKNPLQKIEEFFNYDENKQIKDIYKPCKFPFSNTFITPEGNIYPCLSQKMGNVKENTIKEIFNKPNYCCFRKNLKASKVFGACQMCCELDLK